MSKHPQLSTRLITNLRRSLRRNFRTKILVVSVSATFFGILLTSAISLIGINALTDRASDEIERGLSAISREYLEQHIEDTAECVNLWMGHAQADLQILADITQTLIDHREEFRPLTEVVTQLPFFQDKIQAHPEDRYSQNTSDEPTVVTIQGILHDEAFQIKPPPQQIINETAILDLIMPSIHRYGAKKTWTYFIGGRNASFLRMTPWTDFGKEAVKLYPQQMEVSYWSFFPGLPEAWESWLADPEHAHKTPSDVTTFPPAVDAASGSIIQMFGHPLWNPERSQFAGAVWYDLALDDITETIKTIQLAETGFAFLTLADGNVFAIPERGIRVMGLREQVVGDGHLRRVLEDSREQDIAALSLPQNDEVSSSEIRLSGREYILVMRRLNPMNVFHDGAEKTWVEHWTLGFAIPKEEIFLPLIAAQQSVSNYSGNILFGQIFVLIATILILMGLLYLVTNQMTVNLVKLSDGAHRIMEGDYENRVQLESEDEIGQLGRIFNNMIDQLEQSFEKTEQQNLELRQEIQERTRIEKTLTYERYLLHILMDNSLDHIYFKDVEGRFIRVNKAMTHWFGLDDPLQVLNKTDFDFFTEEHARQAYEDEQAIMRSGHSMVKEEKETWPDGRKTWVSTTKSPIYDENACIIGTFGISRDITQRKQMEESLQESEEKYRTLHESMMDAFVRVDMEGNIKEFNQAYLQMLGYSAEEIMTLTYVDLTPEKWHECEAKIVEEQILTRGFSGVYEKEYIKKDGTVFPVELRTFLIKDTSGDPKSMWAIVRDITERKRAENMLKEYSERLEDMVIERTQKLQDAQEELVRQEKLAVLGQLAGGMAHELRNPLGAINNATYFLNMTLKDLGPEGKEVLTILKREVETSERIIDNLLNLAHPGSPIQRTVNLNDVVQQVLSGFTVPGNIQIICQLDNTLPVVSADPDQLKQIFENIIRNAIQAMPEGGRLTIEAAEAAGIPPRSGEIAVSFTDTGMGIAEEHLGNVFEPLFTTKAKGIGLGLALSKMLTETNGGTIEVESEEGEGSTFIVRLPLEGETFLQNSHVS